MTDLKGKSALVTGSVQGIGLAVAEALAGAGARIAVHGLATPDEAAEVCAELQAKGAPDARFFPADMRDPDQIETMLAAVEAWGPVDILVNNAGIQRTAALKDVTREIWDAIIAVNLSAAYHTMHGILPGMARRGFGRVVNIASVHGLVASKNKVPYVASKFGLVGMSKVAALEYADAGSKASGGVTVNCIAPGWTETAIIEPQVAERAAQFGGDRDKGIADLLSEKQPTKRTSDPSEIGALALWLCAPIAHNVTGTVIPVDGGWTAQ
ncbi:SDR family NAD(P)-dependent oxidoreductase [Marimonas arenosa]|uniref:SDR family NAD(P)-dependent oxidoreductase n=1 Tax=Marimonas arenosa TaxID=1795305 RepID=A0AAE4B6J0_9RHOB|nr:SDR family NAD(P)-dependent oxidoreductase [Marimonas arenosa]MDQ2091399.1 SDR family NAD(P)-dependent oxidoreductase [Marimonas arenosa]